MNKSELILSIEEKSGLSKQDSKKALEAVLETITEELVSGNKVSIVGFGSFDVKLRNERIGAILRPKKKSPFRLVASRNSRPERPLRMLLQVIF